MENLNQTKQKVLFSQQSISTQTFSEKIISGNKYVNYGEDNKYPDYLWQLYINSSIHQAIVDGTRDYILGEGITTTRTDKKKIEKLIKGISFDLVTFGGFAIEIVYNMIGNIVKVNYLDFMKCRINKELTKVYYSNNWGEWRSDAIEYDVYNPEAEKKTAQILYYRGDRTRSVYPIPHYVGSTQAIETSIEIQNYHLNAIRNNFAVSAIINFVGEPTEEEKEAIETGVSNKFTGSSNASRFMLSFNATKDDETTVTRLESDNADEKFVQLQKDTKESIFVGHRVTSPSLFGMLPENGGFNSTEYQESFKIYNKTVIQPLQDEISEVLYDIYGEEITFIPFQIPTFDA